ncbi:MAG: transposase [Bacteriovorax sp.]
MESNSGRYQKCNFVISLKENVWSSVLTKNKRNIKWQKTRFQFFDSTNCEIGSCLYPLKGLAAGRSFLRVVFIRTKNLTPKKEDKHPYYYYEVVTDMSESEISSEHILKFYRKRSQIENNIKDIKNGMDFHHFPCMSLKANNVWGIVGVIVYNLMRYASFAVAPNGCFVATTRKKMVN